MSINVDIISKLVPNPLTMVVQLCSTLVLFLLIRIFLWKPIQNFFAVRENKLQEDITAGETARKDAEADREKAREQLNTAAGKADEIVNTAVEEARSEKDTILAQAQKEADGVRQKAHEQIEQERSAMMDSVKEDMVDIAMTAAKKLIGDKADSDMDHQAVEAFVKEAADNDE